MKGSTETVPPPATTWAPSISTPASLIEKVTSSAVTAVPTARLSAVSFWFGAVTRGVRLLKTMSPRSPFTAPTGLTKSRPGVTRWPLEVGSASLVQSKRPSKLTAPSTGDCRKSAASGLSIAG